MKDLKIYVPEAVAVGDAVTLSCYYNLENVSISNKRIEATTSETHNYSIHRFYPHSSSVMCLQLQKFIATNKMCIFEKCASAQV